MNPVQETRVAKKVRFKCGLSPGDIVMLTAAVKALHTTYPGQFITDVATSCHEVWENNPDITKLGSDEPDVTDINVQYPLINKSNQLPYHFIHGYCQNIGDQLGVALAPVEFKGAIYLSDKEKSEPSPVTERFGYDGPYAVIMAGGKNDFTAKWWAPDYYQTVVDAMVGSIPFVQCGDGGKSHWHLPLNNVMSLVGVTNLREFIRVIHRAEVVVCPVTFAMHAAAAVPRQEGKKGTRPCVVISGGREPAHWEEYPGHQFLHTIGQLPCCANGGCWKSRCQTVGDGEKSDRENTCERPVQLTSSLRIPMCMHMITPVAVIDQIRSWMSGGMIDTSTYAVP
jgi:ADP-heptose:LPS heptosyltransferase